MGGGTRDTDAQGETVLFPTIGGGRVDLLHVSCVRVTGWDNKERPIRAPSLPAALGVLVDARALEGPATIELGVLVRVTGGPFGGDSVGLALALADKFARFGRTRPQCEVIATGALVPGGQGALGRIEGFAGKSVGIVEYLREERLESAIYVFAAANEPDLTPEIRALLDDAGAELGLQCRAASHLSDLADLWPAEDEALPSRPKRSVWRAAAIVVALATAGAAAAVAFWPGGNVAPSPVTACMESTPLKPPRALANDELGDGEYGLAARLDGNGAQFGIGEPIVLRINVDRPAHIRALSLDRDGRIQTLYPNRFQPDAVLAPDRQLTIHLKAAAPVGPNLLEVFASGAPLPAQADATGDWQEKMICLGITP